MHIYDKRLKSSVAYRRERGAGLRAKDGRDVRVMVGATGQKGVPVMKINEEYVVGFDRVKLGRMV